MCEEEEEEGGGRVSLEVVVDPRRRDAVRVKQLAFGEVALSRSRLARAHSARSRAERPHAGGAAGTRSGARAP